MRTTRLAQGTTLVLGLAFLSVIAHFGNSADGIRTLDPWEMAATFGDDVTFEEPGTTSCNRGVIEGDTDCASCGDPAKAANDTRYICCKCAPKQKAENATPRPAQPCVANSISTLALETATPTTAEGATSFGTRSAALALASIRQPGAACEYPPDPG